MTTALFLLIIISFVIYTIIVVVRWPWVGVWLLFIGAAFYPLFVVIPMPTFSGSGFVFTDPLMIIVVACVGLSIGKRNWFGFRGAPRYFYWLWGLFVPPLLVSVIQDYNIFTVFRDARVLVYYGALFPLYTLFKSDSWKLQRFLRHIMYFSIAALGTYYLMAALDISYHVGRMVPDFRGGLHYTWWGLASWFYLYLYAILYLLPRFALKLEKHLGVFIVLWIILTITVLRLLIRSIFLGWFFGCGFIVLMLAQQFRRRAALFATGFILVIVTAVLLNLPDKKLQSSAIISRYSSLVSQGLPYSSAEGNVKLRRDALLQFNKNEGVFKLIGSGYGDEKLMHKSMRNNIKIRLMNHSAWGWLLARLGVLGGLLFIILLIYPLFTSWKKHVSVDVIASNLSLRAFIVSMAVVGFGANVFFFQKYAIIYIVFTMAAMESLRKLDITVNGVRDSCTPIADR